MGRAWSGAWLVVILCTACGTHGSGDGTVEDAADDAAADAISEAPEEVDTGPSPDETDADGDTISDADEGSVESVDTDGDGTEDHLDLDSDDDTIPDAVEAGDEDLETPPRDTDGDGTADFRDTDSDDDGLTDAYEMEIGGCSADEIASCCPNPYNPDSDGDGAGDLLESRAGGTDPWTGIRGNPCDYEFHWTDHGTFWVPYEDDPLPSGESFGAVPHIWRADVFLSVDASPSMSEEVEALRSSWSTSIAPEIHVSVPDVRFGLGSFADCSGCSSHMSVLAGMTDDHDAVQAALDSMTATCGTTPPHLHALYATVTGNLAPFSAWGGLDPVDWTCDPGQWGWPCFRSGAVPIFIQIGDKEFDGGMTACAPGPSHSETVDALNTVGAMYIGINSGAARPDMEAIAGGTGTKDLTSTPLVFNTPEDGSGLASTIATAIDVLTGRVLLDVSFEVRDDPSDAVDATTFIDRIEPNVSGVPLEASWPGTVCTAGLTTDGDAFVAILPDTPLCLDVLPARNTVVGPSDEDQLFDVQVEVLSDGIAMGQTFELTFVVPRR